MNADVGKLASNWLAKEEAQACLRVALAGRDFVRARLGQAGLDHPAP